MQIQTKTNNEWLSDSWQRSELAGLNTRKLPGECRLGGAQLKDRQSRLAHLARLVERLALPLFSQLFAHTNSKLILTDNEGVIINSWGQEKFHDRFASIALETGVCWQEKLKGTNAIGTALFERQSVSVIGGQHFVHQHRFISCSAGPLFDHNGELLGVLDITSEQQVHQADTPLLIQSMTRAIENELLLNHPDGRMRFDLAVDNNLLESGWQGIVITDDNGNIVAHNQIAQQVLERPALIGRPLQQLLDSCDSPLVYKQHKQATPVRKKQAVYSPSSELHHGEIRIEQAWQQACKLIDKNISLLILGETGVGKNEFVKQLHRQSQRSKAPLVTVNCGALPKDLIESELFGYAPGAFTGANSKGYLGKIRQADKGILFLDEIADMPLDAQCRLLHVLQDREVVPIGSNNSYPVDTQIIAATHKNLPELVEQGLFRQDLFYRINGLSLNLPALRERCDLTELIQRIHTKYAPSEQTISPQLLDALQHYPWPGNIRELDNTLKVACLLGSDAPALLPEHFPVHITAGSVQPCSADKHSSVTDEQAAPTSLQDTMEQTLLTTYREANGNISQTSKLLGISRNTIYRKLKKLGILPG